MDDKKQLKNINPLVLGQLNTAIETMRKQYASIIDSHSFQLLLKDMPRINQMADEMMKTYKIFDEQHKKRQETIEKLIKPMMLSLKIPAIMSPSPVIHLKRTEYSYSQSELDDIAKKIIKKVIKEVENGNIQINNKYKLPVKLPVKYQWENITIKFRDRHNVQIVAGENVDTLSYKEMGFEDSRQLKPNHQWILLEQLSKLNGRISWDDNNANTLIKKKKQLLANTLKQYFDISEDPFRPYRKEKAYQIRINLIPETESINKEPSKNDDLDIEGSYKEITEQE